MTNARASRIDHMILNTADVAAASAFYVNALGFSRDGDDAAGGAWLRLGEQRLLLSPADGAAYPEPRAANDPWFQHFAIVVSDMAAAYARVSHYGQIPISRGGPQLLPPITGGVTAYKFRDPEGHPLELSHIPSSDAWGAVAHANPQSIFLGIDHTAIAAPDLEASLAELRALGFTEGPRFLNTGPEQDRLDGLDSVVLDIATMMAPDGGPHIELLHYRAPVAVAPIAVAETDIAATRTVFGCADGSAITAILTR